MDETEIKKTDAPEESVQQGASDRQKVKTEQTKRDTAEHSVKQGTSDTQKVKTDQTKRLTPEEARLRPFLKEKCQYLFEGVPHQGDARLLQDIYTDLYITEGGSGEVNEEHEVRQIEKASMFYNKCSDISDDEEGDESDDIEGREGSDDRPIKCSDLFKPLRQHKPIRVVLTKGLAGIGKTVSVQKFILDWTEGETNQDIHFIFPLPFRELNLMKDRQISLVELIQHFFTQINDLNVLSSSEYKTLFIFDGLDECRLPLNFNINPRWCEVTEPASVDELLTNLINGNLLPSAHVWITTRPAAAGLIPPECVDQVTEIWGFNDPQKDDYFKKRISDENLAIRFIRHLKSSRSLYIMCHIPVFSWILATVAEITSERGEMPRTLAQMFTHFLDIQICIKKEKYTERKDTDKEMVSKLGKLAFQQLEKGNLIFYEEDLRKSGIDVTEASLYSGLCTQIFSVEAGHGKVFSFVNLSIQEFLAALYVFLCFCNNVRNIPHQDEYSQLSALFKAVTLANLHKTAVDVALQRRNGKLDLFLRFLLGLSLESNQKLLRNLLPQINIQPADLGQTVQYVKHRIRHVLKPERKINLFYCLNELNQHAVVEYIDRSSGDMIVEMLLPGQWETRKFWFELSEEQLNGFDLQKYIKTPAEDLTDLLSPDDVLKKLVPAVSSALLQHCSLTEKSCAAIAAAARSTCCSLKNLYLSWNRLHDAGVQHLSDLIKDPRCKLETLELENCSLTEKSCTLIAAAARSTSCSLKSLNLRGNVLTDEGIQHLTDLLKHPQCKLETLQLDPPYGTLRREIPAAAAASSSSSHSSDAAGAQLSSLHTHTEDGPSDDTHSGCECCAEVPDTSHWVLLDPEVSTEKSISTYSLSSVAGRYECSESSLRWSCVGPVTLQYRFMDWQIFAGELVHMQYSPAGPLMDIKLMSGKLEEIHLPHFLCLEGCQSALTDGVKVLHEQDGAVYLEPCELTRHHARLLQPSLSPRGLLYNFTSWLFGKVHANVLVYQCSESHLVFRCYLLPDDAHQKQKVDCEEQRCGGVKKLYPNPNDSLRINECYSLCADQSTDVVPKINPDKLELMYRETPNFFQVKFPDPAPASIQLQLFSSASRGQQAVWSADLQTGAQGRQTRSRGLTEDGPSQSSRVPGQVGSLIAAAFVDGNIAEIVGRVAEVMPIADQLFSQGIIGQETYGNIQAAITNQDKMRKLYDGLRSPGAQGKLALYRALWARERHLVEELWTAE
ncbi:NACHT, LRR and PYD domains-containing protein 3-like isoform X2 [Engraulis encrasicolus]|uniref:NACHT, LRR and PYD domains-containing protein 3-like isoform X2 n=1 Tax=Engraulis encrasicolus TaxID=184585 RepID=UPI002FD1ACF3